MSSGVPSPADTKSLRDLEVMKACHDVASIVTEGPLGLIRERYSIPKEYVLYAPLPEQRPYHPESTELSILVDALEVGLCFPLHPTIVDCLRWWRISPSQVAPNSWRYLIAFLGTMVLSTLQGMPKVSGGKTTVAVRAPPSPLEVEEVCVEGLQG
ncbi:hypothetical protein B296_00040336 [Ensete ventricosum]|uniref:Transposase (putative) gypsy type domain-containing protein n=1 Tax=Ensete ventricosum TaxID=4639 RepID=A0A426Z7L9_ENSVE|nr:hypothetical protein B296_00040336 [Ensete ventricosum]